MQYQTLPEMLQARVDQSGDRVALRFKSGGQWRTLSWKEWESRSRQVAQGLVDLGIEPGDRVALLSTTRVEWVLVDFGILMAGAINVPIYPSTPAEQCEHILNDSGCKLVFAEDASQLDKLEKIRTNLPEVKRVVTFEPVPTGSAWAMNLGQLFLSVDPASPGVKERVEALSSKDPATIVYTPGTTGYPKGAVLTHGNFCFEESALVRAIPIGEEDEQLLFLPLAHVLARTLYLAAPQAGASIAFAESPEKMLQNLSEVHPTFVCSVPRTYEKIYAQLRSAAEQAGGLKRKVFDWALGVGKRHSLARQRGAPGRGLAMRVADRLVFAGLRAAFGGRLRFLISGAAPLSREIAEFFHAAGLLILEGYGLTETTGATHVNRLERYRFGTVGLALPGVETRIAPDGEILLRGENIMAGYYRRPEETREVIEPDGWFHTGDVGELDADGFLRITDRKKDIIVTSGGKSIAPQNFENLLRSEPLVSEVMVVGDQKPYCVALFTLNEEALLKFARERGLQGKDYAELTQHPLVKAEVARLVARQNEKLASYESVKRFAILPQDFTLGSGELTPTLKVKRKFTTQKYWDIIESLYGER
jgi:long-chain acyl-CoA synthetase